MENFVYYIGKNSILTNFNLNIVSSYAKKKIPIN